MGKKDEMNSPKKEGLTGCGVKAKPCHNSWGKFYFCPKCGEMIEQCAKAAKEK